MISGNRVLSQDGLSLVEVLASCAILAVVVIGLVTFAGTTRLSHTDDVYRTQASAAEEGITASLMSHAASASTLSSYISQINHQSVAALGVSGNAGPVQNLYLSIAPIVKLNAVTLLAQSPSVTDPGLPADVHSVSQYNAITTGDGVYQVVVTVYWKG